ncbi:MAG: TrbC/VirB2 family protein [Neisseriaceae bacterium]|nr:TrbC/VirB2 family protein [Neisseriaceae bacterium]MBR3425857.1 TrbC/VirB2 family protein [Neisseriaceae bacterium]
MKLLKVWNKLNQKTAMLLFPLFVLLVTNSALASTSNKIQGVDDSGSEAFGSVWGWLVGILQGNGGKTIAVIALIVGIATASTGHYKMMIAAVVVMLGALVGPVVIDTGFSATW